eukprot:6505848-Lingulodinium_polyedra.AAC.1
MEQATGGCLSVATGCSGTDVIVHILQMMLREWQQQFGMNLRLRHSFAVEKVDYKQQFLLCHGQPTALFADMEEVGHSARAMD